MATTVINNGRAGGRTALYWVFALIVAALISAVYLSNRGTDSSTPAEPPPTMQRGTVGPGPDSPPPPPTR